jgi:hypothetical protein
LYSQNPRLMATRISQSFLISDPDQQT